ncbi:hypothetical protein [Flammeovirga kamogawensis]|uniref:DUF4595 domain-containing protein n=1 Tax=Flammeovirga kamogawensis TaxID=373891 RepID=A0ABX8H2A2_9BACT|nr:hypothetical protein [Flammeovirga kamogawensis]MBB6462410.1 hypothetical protein [Flammeovirga kamogawensis]QWG09522.1 hypothetical protein KM029_23225 [Flammeovirga kamogawensis]TRX65038.1 hypothetical protein EO216_21125 [Flammeovirga kamogawensis]
MKNLFITLSILVCISCNNDKDEVIVPEVTPTTNTIPQTDDKKEEDKKKEEEPIAETSKFNNKEYRISSYKTNKSNMILTFEYDKNNHVVGGEFKGEKYNVVYTNGQISKIDVVNGPTFNISYNGNTITQKITNTNFSNDEVTYTLNADGKVIKIKNSSGFIDFEFEYDANGNVKKSLEVDTGKDWEHNFSEKIDSPYAPVKEVVRYFQLMLGKDLHQSIETESTNRIAKWYGWDYIYSESDLSFTQELKGQSLLTTITFKKL